MIIEGKKMKKIGSEVLKILDEEFVSSRNRVKLSSGQVIRGLREKMEWTQSELSLKTGLKQNTISALENDRISIGVERAKTLAQVFGVHPGLLAFPGWEVRGRKAA